MFDKSDKTMSFGKDDVNLRAKSDVLKALKELANELILKEGGDSMDGSDMGQDPHSAHPGAIVAKVDVKKVSPFGKPAAGGAFADDSSDEEDMMDHGADEGSEDEGDEHSKMLEMLLSKIK